MFPLSPEQVVATQLDAYNRKDLDAWLATYAVDAKQYAFPDQLLASGHAQIKARTGPRFEEPNLHAKLLQRSVMGDVVIDHEVVTRTFPNEGAGTQELVCIYRIGSGKIQEASFVMGEKKLTQSFSV